MSIKIHDDLYPPLAPSSLHPVEEPGKLALELHKAVERVGQQVTFISYGSGRDSSYPVVGGTYIFRPWWSPDQLLLALDTKRIWKKHRFVPRDAVEFVLEGGIRMARPVRAGETEYQGLRINEAGWDHEHCALCWQRISAYEGDEPTGYSSDGDWICEACYRGFIESGLGRALGDEAWSPEDE